jgi:hypothetical protein
MAGIISPALQDGDSELSVSFGRGRLSMSPWIRRFAPARLVPRVAAYRSSAAFVDCFLSNPCYDIAVILEHLEV